MLKYHSGQAHSASLSAMLKTSSRHGESPSEIGQALPIVLIVMLLATAFVIPAVVYANSALIGQRTAKEALVDEYSADSAITFVMWKLWTVTGYSSAPPAQECVTLNGLTVCTNIDKLVTSDLVDFTYKLNVTNKPMSAGHQLWIILSTPDNTGGGVYLAYDTANTSSRLKVPWVTQGTTTYYWHNYPTPPTGDTTIPILMPDAPCDSTPTCYDALKMDTTTPTAAVVYNYDTNHDIYQGRLIEQSNDGVQCAAKVTASQNVRLIWRSPTLSSNDTLNGEMEARWWWAIGDQSFGSHDITLWFCDFDTALPVRDTGSRNPANLLSASDGKQKVGQTPVWVDAFDLKANARGKYIGARVDKTGTGMRNRSWQLGSN